MKHFITILLICYSVITVNAQENLQDTTIYNIADEMPQFPGGMEKFNQYIAESIKSSSDSCFVSRIYLFFIIEKNGTLSNKQIWIKDELFEVEKQNIDLCKKEWDKILLPILNNMPNWTPGKIKGKYVRVQYRVSLSLHPNY